jgi:outer membrane protein assembly factor BamB
LSGPIVTGWDGRLFIPAAGKIFCCTASGTLLWTSELGGRISFGPILDQNGCVLLALENSELIRVNPFGAVKSWKLPSVPVILVSAGKDILALYRGGNILRVDSSVENSTHVFLPGLTARPLAAAGRDNMTAVFLDNGQVALLSGNDGKILWIADSHISLRDERAELIFDKRGICALSTGGAASFTDGGALLWFINLENASGVPAFGDDGVLYSGGKDWILNAWKPEDRIVNQKPSGPEPVSYYGTGNPPPSVFARITGRFSEAPVRRELETIQSGISGGKVGGNELAWFAYLMETAIGGHWYTATNSREPRAVINHRILALQLLSRMGSIETVPWLVSFFKKETEPLVRIAAVAAIGSIGIDPEGKAIQEFTTAVRIGNSSSDEQLFIAIAAAAGALCRFSGPPLYETGSQLLDLLNNPGLPPSVRRQAQNELDSLR